MVGLSTVEHAGARLSDSAQARLRRSRALAAIFLIAIIAMAGAGLGGILSADVVDAHAQRLALQLLTGIGLLSLSVGLVSLRAVAGDGTRAEERAEESEARMRDFAELGAEWFCELDGDLRITYLSNRFFGDSSSSARDWIGQLWLDAGRRSDFWSLSDSHRSRVLAHDPFHGHRFRQRTPEGRTFHWSISGKPLHDGKGVFTGYRIAACDITLLVRAQEELVTAHDAAERASRAKASFLSNMGHELRTPLVAVLGFSEMIVRESAGPLENTKYIDYARDIHDAGAQLLETLNDILELSAIEGGQVALNEQEFALWDVIDGMLRDCRPSARVAGIFLAADIPQTLPCIWGDPVRIKQIIVHIVSNALKFTASGGRVSLSCRTEKAGHLSIIVRDNGAGMAPEDIRKALQPFEQVDDGSNRKFEGVGLGLSLAEMLARYHGGSLGIASAPGRGTVVTFTLPAARVMRQKFVVVGGRD